MNPASPTAVDDSASLSGKPQPVYEQKHLPALDGVRGIAIGMVLLVHLDAILRTVGAGPYLQFGWMGVDLFFVLSGFLITRILLDTRNGERYYRRFYIRRGLRIWPLYYLYIPVTLLYLHLFAHLAAKGLTVGAESFSFRIVSPIWVYLLFLQNLNPAALFSFGDAMLGITWSLCIEEHFYLVWPVCVRYLSRRVLAGVLIAILAISPALRLLAYHVERNAPFSTWYQTIVRFTPMHLDSIAIGCLLCLAWVGMKNRQKSLLPFSVMFVVGAILSAICLKYVQNPYIFSFCYSFVAIMFAGLTGMTLNGWGQRFFTLRPLRYLGKISYGVYLIHPFIFVFFQSHHVYVKLGMGNHIRVAECLAAIVAISLSVFVATLSWKFYESKVLALKARLAP